LRRCEPLELRSLVEPNCHLYMRMRPLMASVSAVSEPSVVSACPGCGTHYALPVGRLGPAGARIRCPRCERVYDFVPPLEPGSVEPEATDDLGVRLPEVIARIAIEEIGDARAREMVAADARGELFARHGAALLDAFDRYRRRAGHDAPAEVFLTALRERLGIDLPSWKPAG
jgi:predicted Zn finger-like uncharacterized protein